MTPREIDVLVAKKVMGWKERTPNHWLAPQYPDGHQFTVHGDEIPQFSTDIVEARKVWHQLLTEKLDFGLSNRDGEVNQFETEFYAWVEGKWVHYAAEANSESLAVCLAALKAKGVPCD